MIQTHLLIIYAKCFLMVFCSSTSAAVELSSWHSVLLSLSSGCYPVEFKGHMFWCMLWCLQQWSVTEPAQSGCNSRDDTHGEPYARWCYWQFRHSPRSPVSPTILGPAQSKLHITYSHLLAFSCACAL